MTVVEHVKDNLTSMGQQIVEGLGDLLAKWVIGIAGLLMAALLIGGFSFAWSTAQAMQHVEDEVSGLRQDVNRLSQKVDKLP